MINSHRNPDPDASTAIATVRANINHDHALLRGQQSRLVRLALNEAEALAWQTQFPHLVFPSLAEEKVRAVLLWHERQESLKWEDCAQAFAA
jgi:hypothetical protein